MTGTVDVHALAVDTIKQGGAQAWFDKAWHTAEAWSVDGPDSPGVVIIDEIRDSDGNLLYSRDGDA